jgi:hypothetical protein
MNQKRVWLLLQSLSSLVASAFNDTDNKRHTWFLLYLTLAEKLLYANEALIGTGSRSYEH